jgi:zinc protease
MAHRIASRIFFGEGHPYALPASGRGYLDTVEKLTREDVLKWYASAIRPGGAVLSVVGDISMEELAPKLEKVLAGWSGTAAPRTPVPIARLVDKPVVYLVDRPGSLQSVILAGHPAPPTNNPDELAFEGVDKIIGGDFLSRLNMNLREDKHWSYGVYTLFAEALGQRAFSVFAPVQTDKTKESLVEIRRELTEIVGARPPTVEEFARTQADRVLQLPGQWETTRAIQGSLGYLLTYGLPDGYYQTYADAIRKLTREQIVQAASKLLKPGSLVWVIVGDRAKIEKGVRELNLGELHLADADGNPVN